jgi:hypothetical protein
MDQCIYDLLSRLPLQVKRLPEVAALLANDGNLIDAMEEPKDQSGYFIALTRAMSRKVVGSKRNKNNTDIDYDSSPSTRKKKANSKMVTIKSRDFRASVTSQITPPPATPPQPEALVEESLEMLHD